MEFKVLIISVLLLSDKDFYIIKTKSVTRRVQLVPIGKPTICLLGHELLRVLLPKGELCRLCFAESITSNEFFATCWPSGGWGVWVLQRVKYATPHSFFFFFFFFFFF